MVSAELCELAGALTPFHIQKGHKRGDVCLIVFKYTYKAHTPYIWHFCNKLSLAPSRMKEKP